MTSGRCCSRHFECLGIDVDTLDQRGPVALFSASLMGIGDAMYFPRVNALIADKIRRDAMEAVYSIQAVMVNSIYGISSLIGWLPEILVSQSGYGLSEAYRISMVRLVPIGLAASIPIMSVTKSSRLSNKKALSVPGKPIIKFGLTQILIGFGAGLSIPLLSYYRSTKFGVE